MSTKTIPYVANKVKDMSLAEWGRKEIELAEAEMPGLVSLREEYGNSTPDPLQNKEQYPYRVCQKCEYCTSAALL